MRFESAPGAQQAQRKQEPRRQCELTEPRPRGSPRGRVGARCGQGRPQPDPQRSSRGSPNTGKRNDAPTRRALWVWGGGVYGARPEVGARARQGRRAGGRRTREGREIGGSGGPRRPGLREQHLVALRKREGGSESGRGPAQGGHGAQDGVRGGREPRGGLANRPAGVESGG